MNTLKIIEGQIENVVEQICNLSGYGMTLHPNDIKPNIKHLVVQILQSEIERKRVMKEDGQIICALEEDITHLTVLLDSLK